MAGGETTATARDAAAATIKREHQDLAMVVEVLQRALADIAREHAEPDFALLCAALWYIDDFPERCHHPKEDEYWFNMLRLRTAGFNEVLDELQAEHVRSAQMMNHLHRALVHYQGGAPDGLRRLRTAVEAYAALLADHMRKEEVLLARAQECLNEGDWSRMAAAFSANEDPVFGASPREEFHRLRLRIVNMLPRRMKKGLQRDS
jgi:hemerythrin-like domain-containing protein